MAFVILHLSGYLKKRGQKTVYIYIYILMQYMQYIYAVIYICSYMQLYICSYMQYIYAVIYIYIYIYNYN